MNSLPYSGFLNNMYVYQSLTYPDFWSYIHIILLIVFSLPSIQFFMIEGTFLVFIGMPSTYACSYVSMSMGVSLVCFANDFMANLTCYDD